VQDPFPRPSPSDSAGVPPSGDPPAAELIGRVDPRAARSAIAGVAVRTPTLACEDLAERARTPTALKAECLQRAGSFKVRGALAKVAALGERAAGGLVTGSAGNHALAVAHAARVRGVSCQVFMPRDASVSKVAAVKRLGAAVHLEGDSVEDALALAAECGEQGGPALVHPFDDLDVIAGQGTIGLELLEDVPDLARVVVPVGGGGLASGIGVALRHAPAAV
jgi:threonine dehydratase